VVEPRVCSVPPHATSLGKEAIELSRMAGLELDDWQAFVLERSLGVREDKRWAAFEVGVNVSRQNGKGGILEARALAGLYLLPERMIIHSAHQFDTSLEAFRRLLWLIEDTPELDKQVKRIARSHGEEGVELMDGSRIRFRTRTKGGGRGFTCDCLILDEAMVLAEPFHGALLPTLSARSITGNPQVWYAGSAVDQEVHEHGVVWARIRERGHKGDDPSLAYFEWSAEGFENAGQVTDEAAVDEQLWRQANPALDIRISPEHVAYEQRSMDPRTFAVERLGVGDWPRTDHALNTMISLEEWLALLDGDSSPLDPVCLGFDISPERKGAIAAAGRRRDGLWHVEVIDANLRPGKLVRRLLDYAARNQPALITCDGYGPVASVVDLITREGIAVETFSAGQHAQACGRLVDAVADKTLRHLGSAELRDAIRGARTRPLGDAWAWSRKNSTVDISPLVAVTVALSAAIHNEEESVYETRGLVAV
jgi:phage terminase large subunit-like protein